MTVKEAVIRVIIENYPIVKNHLIENAHPKFLMSGLQRMREIRKLAGAVYPFDRETNTYDFSETPIGFFKGLLIKQGAETRAEEQGEIEPIRHPAHIHYRTYEEIEALQERRLF